MTQLHLDVDDALAERLLSEAGNAGVSLSSYVMSRIAKDPALQTWPAGYFERFCGFLKDQDFPEPSDSLPEPIELPQ